MVSLKKYTREQILTEGNNRFKKIASLLDREDLEDMLEQSLSWLDQVIFTPRKIIIKPDEFISYNNGLFVDVTPYKIDVINRVYYNSEFDLTNNLFFPDIGLLPYITSGGKSINLSNINDYIALVTNLNMMYRQVDMNGDYELWPKDPDGRQLLQLRNPKLTWVEYLPSIDRNDTEWYLYDFEYASLKDIFFDKCNLFNAEQLMSAQSLGVGKETENIAKYWQDKLEKDKEEFTNKTLVTYLD